MNATETRYIKPGTATGLFNAATLVMGVFGMAADSSLRPARIASDLVDRGATEQPVGQRGEREDDDRERDDLGIGRAQQ